MTSYKGIHKLFMIRPDNFGFNTETKYTNIFQNEINEDEDEVSVKALEEFDEMVEILIENDIEVVVYSDTEEKLPDSVFINSWITVVPEKKGIVFPLLSENRRLERRKDILEDLRDRKIIEEIYDLTFFETEHKFLESTGSVVFDFYSNVAYVTLSKLADETVFRYLCDLLNVEGFVFKSYDFEGRTIHSTDTILVIAKEYSLICVDCIDDLLERSIIVKKLEKTGRELIKLSLDQVLNFSGNCIEVFDSRGVSKLVMSRTAYHSLRETQIKSIEKYSEIIVVNISIIERVGGGSTRCMILGTS